MPTSNPYRLTRAVVPRAYRIFLSPDLDAGSFAGRVEIDVDVAEATDTITLNAIELDLGPATLTGGGSARRSRDAVLDEGLETATFAFDDGAPGRPGDAGDRLHRGPQRPPARLLPLDLHRRRGPGPPIATTQFERVRRPPGLPVLRRAVLQGDLRQVTLTVPSHLAAYSNSPVVDDVDLGNGRRTVSFAPTMKMSTYLVAFVVGPFEETAPRRRRSGSRSRVVYPIGKGHLAAFALEVGAFARSRFFTDYFDIPYPGDKLDLVAIPDFAFGAMENLGLRHLPRDRPADRPGDRVARASASASPRSSPTRSPTCGSATS